MKIVDPKLAFRGGGFAIRNRTERIIIHHAVTPGDVSAATIHGWHLARGWKGLGYHYVIRTSGLIELGRPDDGIGSHAGPFGNSTSIGICLAGDFTKNKPTDEQVTALVELILYLFKKYGILKIQGHRDVAATSCPGAMFSIDKIIQLVDKASKTIEYPPVTASVRGELLEGFIFNGRTMVSAREVLTLLDITYSWDSNKNEVIVGFYRIPTMIVNGVGYCKINDLAAAADRIVKWDERRRIALVA